MYTLQYNDKFLSCLFVDNIDIMFGSENLKDIYKYNNIDIVSNIRRQLEIKYNVSINIIEVDRNG